MRKIEGKAVGLKIPALGQQDSEETRRHKEDLVEKKFNKHKAILKWLAEKFEDFPEELKKDLK